MNSSFRLAAVVLAAAFASTAWADDIDDVADQPDAWYTSDEGRRVLNNVVAWQQPTGGWWKAYDVTQPHGPEDRDPQGGLSTFDNKATWSELRVLAKAYTLTEEPTYRDAFTRGLRATLDAQYANGGFPQQFPPPDNYGAAVTFNDDAMTNVLHLLRDIGEGDAPFRFVPEELRREAAAAFERGLQCVLDSQIRVNGKRTVWCAQHDAETLEPVMARSYELPSFSGSESASLVMLLMSVESPDDEVKQAVESAVAWFHAHRLRGIRLERFDVPDAPRGFDVRVVEDANAPDLWARFYDLETGEPYYADRDGVKVDALDKIGIERRTGYAWLRPFGAKVMDAYPAWATRHGLDPDPAAARSHPAETR